jgi:hypothetical protein
MEDLDEEVLYLVSQLLDSDPSAAELVQKIWSDRDQLARALEHIRDWDMYHPEARTLDLIDAFIAKTFLELSE